MTSRRRGGPRMAPKHRMAGVPWKPAFDPKMEARCMAVTVRDPELGDWSPEAPDTVVRAECVEAKSHMGWHLAQDGYAWSPDDDARHVMLPRG